jgi:hypothetical protein
MALKKQKQDQKYKVNVSLCTYSQDLKNLGSSDTHCKAERGKTNNKVQPIQ